MTPCVVQRACFYIECKHESVPVCVNQRLGHKHGGFAVIRTDLENGARTGAGKLVQLVRIAGLQGDIADSANS